MMTLEEQGFVCMKIDQIYSDFTEMVVGCHGLSITYYDGTIHISLNHLSVNQIPSASA